MKKIGLDIGLLINRLTLGVLMLLHGVHKLLHGMPGVEKQLASRDLPTFLAHGVHLGEIIAPILMIIGFRTRLAALVYTAVMAVAFFLVHTKNLWTLTNNGGWLHELIALFMFGGLALVFTGGGRYAVSRRHRWD